MKVHAVQTGTVQVHERQRTGRGRGLVRFARTLFDATWTEPLPIHAWVIEHPEGLIVVDTGETARSAERGYFPGWHPYYRRGLRVRVAPDQEIGPGLRGLGLSTGDVRWVVLTHLHTDHAGGLHHFPHAEIIVSAREYAAARGLAGRGRGYLPGRWPAWFDPTTPDFDGPDARSLTRGIPLTAAGDVRMVATPGHTAGHVSVLVDSGPGTLFLAGDTSYTEANLVSGAVDGVASMGGGVATAAATLERIRRYAEATPTVYLPSHDPAAGDRLARRAILHTGRLEGEPRAKRRPADSPPTPRSRKAPWAGTRR